MDKGKNKISFIILDENVASLKNLECLLRSEHSFICVGSFTDPQIALENLKHISFDVLFITQKFYQLQNFQINHLTDNKTLCVFMSPTKKSAYDAYLSEAF